MIKIQARIYIDGHDKKLPFYVVQALQDALRVATTEFLRRNYDNTVEFRQWVDIYGQPVVYDDEAKTVSKKGPKAWEYYP